MILLAWGTFDNQVALKVGAWFKIFKIENLKLYTGSHFYEQIAVEAGKGKSDLDVKDDKKPA